MLTDTTCRNLKPQTKPLKKSDGGGLYLLVTSSGSKHWYMAYRFGGRQKKLSFGPYPVVTLAAAREGRDAAKVSLSDGRDPGVLKQVAKRERAMVKATFGKRADEFYAKQKAEGLGEKSLVRTERMIRYLKAEFGKRPFDDVAKQEFRSEFLAWLKKIEKTGKLETVGRLRSTAEQIFDYGDTAGTGINPARNLSKQLIKKTVTPRPALVDPVAAGKLFRTIAMPFTRARFGDVVGIAVRFLAYVAARPGEVLEVEWSEVDFDLARWTIPATKMKMDNELIVPLARQSLNLLRQMRELTPSRNYVFSGSRDQPLSDNTLNKRLRDLGYDTSEQQTGHGFRSIFSTLLNAEIDANDRQLWDKDAVELQLAHLDHTSTRAIYNRTGALSLIGQRTKMMQHWADRIDKMAANNVVSIKRESVPASLSEIESCEVAKSP
jgi:integrase